MNHFLSSDAPRQGLVNFGPLAKSCLLLCWRLVVGEQLKLSFLPTLAACLCNTLAACTSYDRDMGLTKPQIVPVWSFTESCQALPRSKPRQPALTITEKKGQYRCPGMRGLTTDLRDPAASGRQKNPRHCLTLSPKTRKSSSNKQSK